TCGIFPVDNETLRYLTLTGREPDQIALVEAYAKAQGLWRSDDAPVADYSDTLSLDLSTVVPSLAGPKRPQDRIALTDASAQFANLEAAERAKYNDTISTDSGRCAAEGGQTAIDSTNEHEPG